MLVVRNENYSLFFVLFAALIAPSVSLATVWECNFNKKIGSYFAHDKGNKWKTEENDINTQFTLSTEYKDGNQIGKIKYSDMVIGAFYVKFPRFHTF